MRTALDRLARFPSVGSPVLPTLDGVPFLYLPGTGTNQNISYGSSSTFDSINTATMGMWVMRGAAAKDIGLFAHGIQASNNRRTWSAEHSTRGIKLQLVVDRATADSFFESVDTTFGPMEWGAVFCRYVITNGGSDFCEFYEYTVRGGFRPVALDPAAAGYNVGSGAVQASTAQAQIVGNYGNANSNVAAGVGGIGPHFMVADIVPLAQLEAWAVQVHIDVLRGYNVLIHARPGTHFFYVHNEAIGKPQGTANNFGLAGPIPGLDPVRRLRYVARRLRVYGAATGALGALSAVGTATVRVRSTGTGVLVALTAAATVQVLERATGTGALGALTASGAATVRAQGTGSGSLGALTAVATARVLERGTGTGALGALTASGTATVRLQATGTGSLGALGAAGTATARVQGVGTGSLIALTAAGTATVREQATGTGTLGSLSASGAATVRVQGTGSGAVGALTAAGTGRVRVLGAGTGTLAALTVSGSATVKSASTGTGALGALTAAGTATVRVQGSGSGSLGALTATATATARELATGAGTLGAFIASGTATVPVQGTASGSLAALTASGTAAVLVVGAGAVTLPALVAVGVGTVIIIVRHWVALRLEARARIHLPLLAAPSISGRADPHPIDVRLGMAAGRVAPPAAPQLVRVPVRLTP